MSIQAWKQWVIENYKVRSENLYLLVAFSAVQRISFVMQSDWINEFIMDVCWMVLVVFNIIRSIAVWIACACTFLMVPLIPVEKYISKIILIQQ